MSFEINRDLIKTLVSLGLANSEAKTYIALYQIGSSEATPLAEKSDVSQPKIYAILKNLETRGFVTRAEIAGKPNLYHARSYEIVLEELENDLMKKIQSSKRFFEELKVETKDEELKNFVKLAQGIHQVRLGIQEIILHAQKNIYVVPNDTHSKYIRKIINERDDLELVIITEKFKMIAPILGRLKNSIRSETFEKITQGRPLIIIQDVDPIKATARSVNIITPQIDGFDPVLFQIKHPMIVNFQVGLLLSVQELVNSLIPELFGTRE